MEDKLAEQIVKNLAYMGKLLNKYEHLEKDDLSSEIKHDINIEWLIKKVLKEAKYELVNKPKETIKVRPNLYKNLRYRNNEKFIFKSELLYSNGWLL